MKITRYKTIKPIMFSLIWIVSIAFLSCEDNNADKISISEQRLPTVITIIPTSGVFNTTVTITGTNFSSNTEEVKVTFNGIEAALEGSSETSIIALVPSGATSGMVRVEIGASSVQGGPTFTVPEPTISGFSPLSAVVGTVVTITGANFSANIADNVVSFDGTAAVVTESTATSIVTSVPSGATTGVITVEVGGQEAISANDFTLVTGITLMFPLDSNDDDVEEVAESAGDDVGTMSLGSSDLEFGEISSGEGLMNIGLRFNNITIPVGAVIIEASIQFNADNTGADPVELTIYGENVGNSAAYSETIGDLSARALTTANAVWSVPEWVNAGDRTDAQKTVDLKSVIQEIMDRGDWGSGNSLNIIMKHTGVSIGVTSSSGGREAENYSSSTPEDGAELTITYY